MWDTLAAHLLYTVSNFPEHHGHGWKFGSNRQESLQSFISVKMSKSSETLLFSISNSTSSFFLLATATSFKSVSENSLLC